MRESWCQESLKGELGHSILACGAGEPKGSPGLRGATATGCGEIGFASQAQQADGEIAQGGHRLRDAPGAYLGTDPIVSYIAHPV